MTAVVATSPLDPKLINYSEQVQSFLDRLPSHVKKGRLEEAYAQCSHLLAAAPSDEAPASSRPWSRLCASLAELKQQLESGAARQRLLDAYDDAARAYEGWVRAHRTAVGARSALTSRNPLIGPRTLFHMSMAALATLLYQFVLTRAQAVAALLSLLGIFLALEISRRLSGRWNDLLVKRVFRPIARPHEYYRVNSSTWYLLALCLVTPFFSRPAVLTGVLVLGFADPAAAWIGRRFGTLKLHGKKSLQGSLAFVGAGTLVAGAFLVGFYPEFSVGARLVAAFAAALAGGVAELFTSRLDDNLTVPLAAVLSAAIFL